MKPVIQTSQFKRDIKRLKKRGKDLEKLGYLSDYPDHWTQGDDLDDLKEHLRDLHHEFASGELPGIKKMEEIEVG